VCLLTFPTQQWRKRRKRGRFVFLKLRRKGKTPKKFSRGQCSKNNAKVAFLKLSVVSILTVRVCQLSLSLLLGCGAAASSFFIAPHSSSGRWDGACHTRRPKSQSWAQGTKEETKYILSSLLSLSLRRRRLE
jgi:hypothetical protein